MPKDDQEIESDKEQKIRDQLAALHAEKEKIAKAEALLMGRLPPTPINPRDPSTWPWGIKVKAMKQGFYPDRYPLHGHAVPLPKLRQPGEVFEIAHKGHFSSYHDVDAPNGWMGDVDQDIPAGLDPNLPLTTAGNQVQDQNTVRFSEGIDKMDIAKKIGVIGSVKANV